MPTFYPQITASVLKWARMRAHFTEEELAAKVGISNVERYKRIERGEIFPTQAQLRNLGRVLGRPPAFFFLEKPPEDEPDPVTAFRRRFEHLALIDWTEVHALRTVQERRDLVIEALTSLGDSPVIFKEEAVLSSDPEMVADYVRDFLNIPISVQRRWRDPGETFRQFREALDRAGVLVFLLPLNNGSGFALNLRPLPIICISTDEITGQGRSFTMLHELGHLLLGDSVRHPRAMPFDVYSDPQEIWCNRFAAALLIPKDELLSSEEVIYHGDDSISWSEAEIDFLARRFNVSPSTMVRRLYHLGKISNTIYENLKFSFDTRPKPEPRPNSRGPLTHQREAFRWGRGVLKLIFRAHYMGSISLSRLMNILNSSTEGLGRFEKELFGRTYQL